MPADAFWRHKSLREMTREEWEALCDRCGRCCLLKLEDEDTGNVMMTDVACKLLDCRSCRCSNYANRRQFVPECISITPEIAESPPYWLPKTCAYRLVAEGRELFDWHHLVSGDPETVHRAGVSVRGRVISEARVSDRDIVNHVVDTEP